MWRCGQYSHQVGGFSWFFLNVSRVLGLVIVKACHLLAWSALDCCQKAFVPTRAVPFS
ncbi:hypothetical protein [Moraxella lacunata]|uniref:hypothetical protein n=1 Tax=Moraxella lacunata TaxID=477 RepID=UPI003EE0F003